MFVIFALLFFPDLKCWYGICAKCQILQIFPTKMSSLEDVSPIKIERHIDSVHEVERPYDQNIGKVHEVINAFKCNSCAYKTGRKSDLNRHIESVHEGIKKFNCNICDYKSSINYYLKKHIESVHEGIKPFKCNSCDYESAHKTDVKKHTVCYANSKKIDFRCKYNTFVLSFFRWMVTILGSLNQ